MLPSEVEAHPGFGFCVGAVVVDYCKSMASTTIEGGMEGLPFGESL
jgi:hypothetical protein